MRLVCGVALGLAAGCTSIDPFNQRDDTCEVPSEADDGEACGPAVVGLTEFGAFDIEITVGTIEELKEAVADARPGTKVLIAPGTYPTTLLFRAENSGSEERSILVTSRDGLGSVIIDAAGAPITVKFGGASHIKLSGLEFTGGGYHGVFMDKGSHDITIEGNRIYDNTRTPPLDSHAEVKGSSTPELRPARVIIRDNEIFHTTHPPGGNFQGIDCNRCNDFQIAGNYIHDINSPTVQSFSYFDRGSCIQMKSQSTNTVIERNIIEGCNIGIVYGGEGLETPEHVGGIVRNNVIIGSTEMAIAVVNVDGGKIYHNTLFGNGESVRVARDTRFEKNSSNVDTRNNILDHPIREDDGPSMATSNNFVASREAPIFISAENGDFRLSPESFGAIDQGIDLSDEVATDFDGNLRPQGRGFDIGAFESTVDQP